MKIANLIVFISTLFIVSCHQQDNQGKIYPLTQVIDSPTSIHITTPTKETKRILSVNGDTLILALKMDSLGKHQNIPLFIQSGKIIMGELLSKDPSANLRFTQIQLPDRKLDGPFGRNLHYDIKDTGEYHLIIGGNQMAGDPWKGDFILKAWVK